jgi:hypothetical protein
MNQEEQGLALLAVLEARADAAYENNQAYALMAILDQIARAQEAQEAVVEEVVA